MQLDDGLLQAKSRLETFNLAIRAAEQAEQEHGLVSRIQSHRDAFGHLQRKLLHFEKHSMIYQAVHYPGYIN